MFSSLDRTKAAPHTIRERETRYNDTKLVIKPLTLIMSLSFIQWTSELPL